MARPTITAINNKQTRPTITPVFSMPTSSSMEAQGYGGLFSVGTQPQKPQTTLGATLKNTAIQLGKGVAQFGESGFDAALQVGTSKYNPYYMLNPEKLKAHQEIARELQEKQAADSFFENQLKFSSEDQKRLDEQSALKSQGIGGAVAQGIGAMLPTLLVGGLGVGKAAKLAGSTSVLASKAYGGGLSEAIGEGATREEANKYALLSTAVEVGTEYITGGIPGVKAGFLSGFDKLAGKGIQRISNELLKTLANAGYRVVGEAAEEAMAEILNPLIKNMSYKEGEKVDWENVINSAIVGGIIGGILGAPSDVSMARHAAKLQQQAKSVQKPTRPVIEPIQQTQPTTQKDTKVDVQQKGNFDISINQEYAGAKSLHFVKRKDGIYKIVVLDQNNEIMNEATFATEKSLANHFKNEELAKHIVKNSEVNTMNEIMVKSKDTKIGETDYFMNHRPTESGALASDISNKGKFVPTDVYTNPEYYFNMKERYAKESFNVLKNIKEKPNANVTIYRATKGDTINSGDWVTLSKEYAKHHNKSQFDGKGNVVELVVKAKDIQWAGDDINEFGYFPQQTQTATKTKPLTEKPQANTIAETKTDDVLTGFPKDAKKATDIIGKTFKGGKLLIYHQTNSNITSFNKNIPTFFTTEIDKNRGKNVVEAVIDVKNPLNVGNDFWVQSEQPTLIAKAIKDGYDAVTFNHSFTDPTLITQVIALRPTESVKTKSDIINETKTDDTITTKPLTEKQQAKQKIADQEAKTVETLKKDITKAYSKVIPNKFSKKYLKVIQKNPDLVKDIVATKPNGKPAIRQTGVFTPKSFDNHNFKDIKGLAGQQSYNLLAAAGEFDNVTIQQAVKNGEWGPMKNFAFEVDNTIAARQLYVVDKVAVIESIAKKHNVKINKQTGQQLFDALEGRPTTPQMKALAKDIRTELNKLRLEANIQRRALDKPDIGFIKNYVPHMQKVNFFNKKLTDSQTTISDNFDFMIPNAKVNPHAIARKGAEFEMETNAWNLLDTYINSISNDIYTTGIIEKAKSINQVISEKNPAMGNFMNTYIKEQLVGQTAKIDRIIGMQPGTFKKDITNKVTRARNTAALGGNFVWTLITQPASIVNTVARTGWSNTFNGLFKYATNPQIRNQTKQLPSMIIKSKGKSVGRTLGGDVDRLSARIGRTKFDKFNDFLAIMPDAMESYLTGASAVAGFEQGKKLGLTGEALNIYADTMAQNTQSMYNKEARPVIMNNASIRLVAPFQTFAFEQYRYAKQLMGKGGGIPLEARDRLAQAMRLIIAMWLYGMYAEETTGKKLNTAGTFVPFAGSAVDSAISKVGQTIGITPREYSGTGRSPVAPAEEVKKIYEAVDTLVQYGNFNPMRKELVKWGMGFSGVGGASTVNRFVDGLIASEQGYQETRAGRVAFPITTTKDKITSMILGPYSTKAGKEYIKGGFKPLGEVQSSTIKSSSNIGKDFDNMMKTREYNRLIKEYDKLRKEGKSTVEIERKIRNFK
jgi:hypothetical protein